MQKVGQVGFVVCGHLRADLSGEDVDAFLDRVIDAVEAKSLSIGGGAGRGHEFYGCVTREDGEYVTDEDRAALVAFFGGDKDVVDYVVCTLGDVSV
jgi:uncharacterized protein YggL (DUF469 family)